MSFSQQITVLSQKLLCILQKIIELIVVVLNLVTFILSDLIAWAGFVLYLLTGLALFVFIHKYLEKTCGFLLEFLGIEIQNGGAQLVETLRKYLPELGV